MADDQKQTAIMKANGRGLQLASFEDYHRFASTVVEAGLAPRSLDTPQKVMVALQAGAELGMTPMQSLRSICVVNGAPTVYGDAGLALVRNSKELEYIKESIEGKLTADLQNMPGDVRAVCEVKRKGDPEPITRTFCVAEARLAGLWMKTSSKGGPTPWCTHPQRMLKYKARAFALRDTFPDILMGMNLYEEVAEYDERHQVDATVVETKCKSQALLTEQTDGEEGQQRGTIQEQQENDGQAPGLQG